MTSRPARSAPRRELRIVIVGAGFSGIAMALALKRSGHAARMLIVDSADDFGGTWRDNVYPGCACDVPSPVYSLAGEHHDWPQFFSEQPDILAYILAIVDKHNLHSHARLGTHIVEQRWQADRAEWILTTGDGDTIVADVVINGVGPLSKAVIPDIPGRNTFAGPAFHTAQWRHDVDLAGVRVGIIGTGASAVQVVPSIVDDVAEMTVFQRTPSWVLPKADRHFSRFERWALRRVPGLPALVRGIINTVLEKRVWTLFTQDPTASAQARKLGLWNIRQGITDPDLRAALTPTIDVGCKRLLLSNTYYPALDRDHVTVETTGIAAITSTGVELVNGRQVALDVLVWGTGFDAHRFWAPMTIQGQDGRVLDEVWEGAGAAYNSVATPGFPNQFFLLGPNSGTGHNSVVLMAEAQAAYIIQALDYLRDGAMDWLAPSVIAAADYAEEMTARHADLVWASGCGSWYLNADGINDVLYPGSVTHYEHRVSRFDIENYDVGRHESRQVAGQSA